MQINSPLGGAVNMENLPLELFNHVDLYRSRTPFHLQGTNIGGAIDLIPMKPPDKDQLLFVNSGVTSLMGGNLGLGLGLPVTLQYLQIEASMNRYRYLDNNGTPYFNTKDDKIVERKNEDYLQYGYTGLYFFDYKQSTFNIVTDFHSKDQGLAGAIGRETNRVRLETNRGLAKGTWKIPLSDTFLLRSFTGIHLDKINLSDPKMELEIGGKKQERFLWRVEGGLQPTWYIFPKVLSNHILVSASNTKIDENDKAFADRFESNIGTAFEFEPIKWFGRIVLDGKKHLVNDSLNIRLNNLYQTKSEDKYDWLSIGSIHLGIYPGRIFKKINLNKINKSAQNPIELYTQVAYSERYPSLWEKYGDGGLLLPSYNLKKETSLTNTVGIQGDWKFFILNTNLYFAYFHTHMDDLILYIPNSQKTMIAVNIGGADIDGFETEAKVNWEYYVFLDLRYTYLYAIDKSDLPYYQGKFLPYRPRHMFNSMVEIGNHYLRWFAGNIWQGAIYRSRYNSRNSYLDSSSRYYSGLVWIIGRDLNYMFVKEESSTKKNNSSGNNTYENLYKIIFTVKNIFNERAPDVIGYPLPGRYYELKFTAQLK
jgi:hypothetical protein